MFKVILQRCVMSGLFEAVCTGLRMANGEMNKRKRGESQWRDRKAVAYSNADYDKYNLHW